MESTQGDVEEVVEESVGEVLWLRCKLLLFKLQTCFSKRNDVITICVGSLLISLAAISIAFITRLRV